MAGMKKEDFIHYNPVCFEEGYLDSLKEKRKAGELVPAPHDLYEFTGENTHNDKLLRAEGLLVAAEAVAIATSPFAIPDDAPTSSTGEKDPNFEHGHNYTGMQDRQGSRIGRVGAACFSSRGELKDPYKKRMPVHNEVLDDWIGRGGIGLGLRSYYAFGDRYGLGPDGRWTEDPRFRAYWSPMRVDAVAVAYLLLMLQSMRPEPDDPDLYHTTRGDVTSPVSYGLQRPSASPVFTEPIMTEYSTDSELYRETEIDRITAEKVSDVDPVPVDGDLAGEVWDACRRLSYDPKSTGGQYAPITGKCRLAKLCERLTKAVDGLKFSVLTDSIPSASAVTKGSCTNTSVDRWQTVGPQECNEDQSVCKTKRIGWETSTPQTSKGDYAAGNLAGTIGWSVKTQELHPDGSWTTTYTEDSNYTLTSEVYIPSGTGQYRIWDALGIRGSVGAGQDMSKAVSFTGARLIMGVNVEIQKVENQVDVGDPKYAYSRVPIEMELSGTGRDTIATVDWGKADFRESLNTILPGGIPSNHKFFLSFAPYHLEIDVEINLP